MTTVSHHPTSSRKKTMLSTIRTPSTEAPRGVSGPRRLEILTFAALVGVALSLIYVQVLITRSLEPVPTANALVLLLIAAAGARGWRRALPMGVAWTGLMLVASFPVIARRFGHPEDLHLFVWNAATLAVLVGGLVSGVAAWVQRRHAGR
jgi:hypothetical protein